MATLKAANVTKYDAGGSGDNVISDGYIKSVEKVWIDTYAVTAAIASTSSILIGYVPMGKRLKDVIVYMPAMTLLPTVGSVHLGTGATVAAGVLGIMRSDNFAGETYPLSTTTTLRLSPGKQDTVLDTGSDVGIYLTIHISDGDTESTTGTIKSIIKYT